LPFAGAPTLQWQHADLRITRDPLADEGRITRLVCGSPLYDITITIDCPCLRQAVEINSAAICSTSITRSWTLMRGKLATRVSPPDHGTHVRACFPSGHKRSNLRCSCPRRLRTSANHPRRDAVRRSGATTRHRPGVAVLDFRGVIRTKFDLPRPSRLRMRPRHGSRWLAWGLRFRRWRTFGAKFGIRNGGRIRSSVTAGREEKVVKRSRC